MSEEISKCPRCGRTVSPGDASCEWCGLDLLAGGQSQAVSQPWVVPSPQAGLVCANCRAVWPPSTRICPACGHELYLPGYSPEGSWPPVVGGQPLPSPGPPPLMTRSRGGDIATGVFWGLLAGIAALFSSGISIVILLAVFHKPFGKYPYYRRGIFYGGAAAALVLMSAFVACCYVMRQI